MEQILRAYSLPIETAPAMVMLYKNTKVKLRSQDGDTGFFYIVAGIVQADTLVHNLPRLRTSSVDRSNKRKWFYAKKKKGKKQTVPHTSHYGHTTQIT